MPAIKKHPKHKNIHEDCYIEICLANGTVFDDEYDVIIRDTVTGLEVLSEREPDFDWAWQTAEYFRDKYNIDIVDKTPY